MPGTCLLAYTVVQRPEGHFNIFFTEKVFSAYDDTKVSFSTTTQDRILSGRVDDHDKMYEIGCLLSKCDAYRLFSDNPLHMGFFLDSISGGEIEAECYSTHYVHVCISSFDILYSAALLNSLHPYHVHLPFLC